MNLENILNNRDPYEVEDYVSQIWDNTGSKKSVDELIVLLEQDWHFQHENIVLLMQRLKDPSVIDVLFRTAHIKYDYLAYDDVFALARKCTWALADIGTNEARTKLELLEQSCNEYISGYARKRLLNWDRELPRKGL